MRRRHTRNSDPGLNGPTMQRAVRIPAVQLSAVQEAIAEGLPDIHSVTDVVVDALWLWLYEHTHTNGHATPQSTPPTQEVADDEDSDRVYHGDVERPKWSDVDPASLDG